MVQEGHDSTVRPKLQTYEFSNGKLYLDQWASDGKPHFDRATQGRMRALLVFSCVTIGFGCLLRDWGSEENLFSPVRRGLLGWWRTFTALDAADVAKARSVGPPIANAPPTSAPVAPAPKKFKDTSGM